LSENKVKTMLNKEVLRGIEDNATRNILKAILFSPSNLFDWNEAYTIIIAFMPELTKNNGYKAENME
jgi:hypothetical protein